LEFQVLTIVWFFFGGGGDCHARDHMVFGLVSTYSLIACQCY
jgi:hypothetical protein